MVENAHEMSRTGISRGTESRLAVAGVAGKGQREEWGVTANVYRVIF